MDRRSLSLRWPRVVLSLALLSVVAAGCKAGLESMTILWEGYDIPAEWDGLKEKKVVVVCKPIALDFNSLNVVDHALAESITERLKTHVKKIQIIEPREVAELRDKTGMEDYLAIGKKLKAEKVVGVDIQSFGVREGPTLFKGRCRVTIKVYDVAEKQIDWQKSPPQFEFPRFGETPAQEVSETEFRNQFVAGLAEQIARFFYPHDRHDDYASDVVPITR